MKGYRMYNCEVQGKDAAYIQYVAGWDQDMMVLGRGLPPHPGTAGGSVWIQHLLLQVLPPYKPHPRLHIPCV